MAIYLQDIVDINLNGGMIHRNFKSVAIGSGDQNANRFGMRVYRDGVPEDLSGVSCQAVFQDPMGNNIALTSHGTVSGNVAYVTLPQACYNYEGRFCLAIKLIGGGVTGTMRIVDGVVDNTHTGNTVAPTGAVPTYQEVLAAYDDAIAAVVNVDIFTDKVTGIMEGVVTRNDADMIEFNTATGREVNNVTFTRTERTKWSVSGTASGVAFLNILSNFEINPDVMYILKTIGGVAVRIYITLDDNSELTVNYTTAGIYPIIFPYNAKKITLRLNVPNGTVVPTGTTIELHLIQRADIENNNVGNKMEAIARNDEWEIGKGLTVSGNETNTTKNALMRINSKGLLTNLIGACCGSNLLFRVFQYEEDGTCDGSYRYGYYSTSSGSQMLKWFDFREMVKKNYKIEVRKADNSDISESDLKGIVFTGLYLPDHIYPTYDNTDRTKEIEEKLKAYKSVKLEKGKFYAKNIYMPDDTKLEGCGYESELILLPSDAGSEQWTEGNQTFTYYKGFTFDTPLPPGKYTFGVYAESNDTESDKCTIAYYYGDNYDTNYAHYIRFDRETQISVDFEADREITRIELLASNNYTHSRDKTATFSNISFFLNKPADSVIVLGNCNIVRDIKLTGEEANYTIYGTDDLRSGLSLTGDEGATPIGKGVVDGCFFQRFKGGGIRLRNTGPSSANGMNIIGCYFFDCFAGVNISRYSEFHRVVGCSATYCYYGILNNGGNNEFAGCNLSSCAIGIGMDNSAGDKINNTHGGASGCIIQHSTARAVYINDMHSGFVFTGCNIDNGGVEIVDASRIAFVGCNFMAAFDIVITGGGLVLFSNSNMREYTKTHTTITNNNAVKFVQCYDENGNEIDPTA